MADAKAFDCIICLDICRKCIHCTSCHQILCKKHVKKFRDDRCPSCRVSPFQYQQNIALQRIIEQAFPKQEKDTVAKEKKAKKKKHATTITPTTEIEALEPHDYEEEEQSQSAGIPPGLLPGLEWAQESLLVFDEDPPSFDDDPFLAPPLAIPQAYYTDDVLDGWRTLATTVQPENPNDLI